MFTIFAIIGLVFALVAYVIEYRRSKASLRRFIEENKEKYERHS